MGQARLAPQRPERSANRFGLYLWRDLPQGGQRRGAHHAALRGGLKIPSNITLIPLPAKCPELNPQENIWQFIRDNWLSNRIFKSYDDIVDHCCRAWNMLIDQPSRIMSIGMRDWTYQF